MFASRLASAEPAPAATLWVQVSSALACPRPQILLGALRQRLGAGSVRAGTGPSDAPLLRVEPHGRYGIDAVLERGGVRIVARTIDADDRRCDSLAESLALVTESWLPESSSAESSSAESSSPESSSPESGDSPSTGPASAPKSEVSAPTSESAPAASSDPSLATPAPTDRAALDRAADDRHRTQAPPAAAAPIGLAIETAIGSALALDASPSPVGLARASAELSLWPWRLGARGQLETPGDLDANGTVSIRRLGAELLVGADLYPSTRGARDALALGVAMAAGVELLRVNAENYTRPNPGTLVEPSLALGVRGEWRALEHVGLTLGIEGALALRREHLRSDAATSWVTPRARAKLSIGALWHL